MVCFLEIFLKQATSYFHLAYRLQFCVWDLCLTQVVRQTFSASRYCCWVWIYISVGWGPRSWKFSSWTVGSSVLHCLYNYCRFYCSWLYRFRLHLASWLQEFSFNIKVNLWRSFVEVDSWIISSQWNVVWNVLCNVLLLLQVSIYCQGRRSWNFTACSGSW